MVLARIQASDSKATNRESFKFAVLYVRRFFIKCTNAGFIMYTSLFMRNTDGNKKNDKN